MMEVREARRAQTSAYPLPPSESAGAGSPSDSSGDSRSSFIVTGSPPPAS